METTFEKISRKTRRKPVACKCVECKDQCRKCPCLGTPEDILKLINAGYGERLAFTEWRTGQVMGLLDNDLPMVQSMFDKEKRACTFFHNGLCELHDKNLKPTEGRLSHHSERLNPAEPKDCVAWQVAKEWLDPANYETIAAIIVKMSAI